MTPIDSTLPVGPTISRRPTVTDQLEAAFLEQMLGYAGSQAREGATSGGLGEAQFHSLLDREYARLLSSRIDLGLGEIGK